MSHEPVETMWQGRFIAAYRKGKWEYVGRARGISAVVILAEHDGQVILIEQHRVPLGRNCLELPAGLVGDIDEHATIEATAIQELEEETGFTAERIEILGEFYASPGMVSESFTLVRAHGIRKIGDGGGTEHEEITVHLVPRAEVPAFVEAKRAEGCGIDVKMLLLLGGDWLG
jgi:ADP-ribose pyrophosphatase